MIERNKFQLNYIKKESQSGSYLGMRYTLRKSEDGLEVIVYPEPFCLSATSDEKKTSKTFDFSTEGLDAAVDWMNELYESKSDEWMNAYEKRMQF